MDKYLTGGNEIKVAGESAVVGVAYLFAQLMTDANLTPLEFAQKIGKSERWVNCVLEAEAEPSVRELGEICAAFDQEL